MYIVWSIVALIAVNTAQQRRIEFRIYKEISRDKPRNLAIKQPKIHNIIQV
jgi:hypothetical protein